MPGFKYKAIDGTGRFVSGEIDAPDVREVAVRLEQLGYVPVETTLGAAAGDTGGRRLFSFHRPVSQREVTVFLRELALVLHAGVALDEALHMLAGEEGRGLAAVARDLKSAITGGASLAEALRRFPRIFGPDLIAMIRIAEASGNLDGVLESVAEDRARTENLMDKVSSSLRYPAFLFVAAVSVLVFFLIAVVPQFAGVIRDFGKSPDGLVVYILAASDLLVESGTMIAIGVVTAMALGALAFRRPKIRGFAKRQIARLPGLRGILQHRRTVVFCGSLGTLLGNGVTLTEALRVLLDLPGASGEGLDRVVEGIRRGGRLVESLARIGYLPPIALKMLRIGEESGELATVARRIAAFYEAKLAKELDRVATVVGPAAILVIATIIGGLIVSILSALLSINDLVF